MTDCMSGYVQTVTGKIPAEKLGITLSHEHLAINCNTKLWLSKDEAEKVSHVYDTDCFSLGKLGALRQRPYIYHENMAYFGSASEEAVKHDLRVLKQHGETTLVDLTCHGLGRDAGLLKKMSNETGVNVICGTGYYVSCFQNSQTASLSTEQMYNTIIEEITVGCGEAPDVRAGVIGEVGSNWPPDDFERRAIEAAALAQQTTGAPVSFHPGRHPDSPAEIMRIFQEAGGDASRAAMGHLERTIMSAGDLVEFAEKCACYCELDLFGIEVSYYQAMPQVDMPSDGQRLELLKALIEDGYSDRLLISHDIHSKHRLIKYGGHGFSHILENVVPVMKIKLFQEEDINKMLIDNPRRLFAFK